MNIGSGVDIGCDRSFYIAFNNKLHCFLKDLLKILLKVKEC